MRSTSILLFSCALFGLIAGCGREVPVGDHDAGVGTDAAAIDGGPRTDARPDDDGGTIDDDGGTVDEDAGTIDEDGGPIEIDSGWCECPPPPPGCRYVGEPCVCDELLCEDLDAGPPGGFCGGFIGGICRPDEWCDYEEFPGGGTCGIADGGGTCRPRPDGCLEIFSPVCGCDGITYSNECYAQRAGVDVSASGECGSSGECAPDDARGVGACDAIVGYAWDGTMCRWLSGCSCAGEDCGRYTSFEECEGVHAGCPGGTPPSPPG